MLHFTRNAIIGAGSLVSFYTLDLAEAAARLERSAKIRAMRDGTSEQEAIDKILTERSMGLMAMFMLTVLAIAITAATAVIFHSQWAIAPLAWIATLHLGMSLLARKLEPATVHTSP